MSWTMADKSSKSLPIAFHSGEISDYSFRFVESNKLVFDVSHHSGETFEK